MHFMHQHRILAAVLAAGSITTLLMLILAASVHSKAKIMRQAYREDRAIKRTIEAVNADAVVRTTKKYDRAA